MMKTVKIKKSVFIILMIFTNIIQTSQSKSSLALHQLRQHPPRHKNRASARKAVDYKYDENTRTGLKYSSLSLLIVTIILLVGAEGFGKLGSKGPIDLVIILVAIATVLTYIGSNAKASPKTRKLRRWQVLKKIEDSSRKLFSVNGISGLYGKVIKQLKSENLKKMCL